MPAHPGAVRLCLIAEVPVEERSHGRAGHGISASDGHALDSELPALGL